MGGRADYRKVVDRTPGTDWGMGYDGKYFWIYFLSVHGCIGWTCIVVVYQAVSILSN